MMCQCKFINGNKCTTPKGSLIVGEVLRVCCNTPGFRVLHLFLWVCANSCPLSQWCYPIILSSVNPFSSSPQSFPASGSFPFSWLFASGDQCIEASASASVLPMHIQGWFPLGLTGLISLLSQGLSRVFSNITVQKHQSLGHSAFFMVQLSHPYMSTGKAIALTIQTFVGKVISLLLNILSRLVIAFLPGGKHLLISWLQSLFTVILEKKKIKLLFPLFPHLFATKWWDWMP